MGTANKDNARVNASGISITAFNKLLAVDILYNAVELKFNPLCNALRIDFMVGTSGVVLSNLNSHLVIV